MEEKTFIDSVPSGRYTNYMKQSDTSAATRHAILQATNRILAERGSEGFTLDAVAREAGISKGGLLYHFASKRTLIQGLLDAMIARVETALEEELAASGGDFLPAYIRASFRTDPGSDRLNQALTAAMSEDPALVEPLRVHFRRMQDQIASAAPTPEAGTLIRLALDGLWLSDLYGFAPPPQPLRDRLRDLLLSIARYEKEEENP